MSKRRSPFLTSRLQGFGTSIFAEMTQLAQAHNAVNLGQGAPNFDGPESIKQAAMQAIAEGHNQYCRAFGLPAFTKAIAEHQKRFWGLNYDPMSEITVCAGATEALYVTLQALTEIGDEVIVFEPHYDSYRAGISMAGAIPRVITLESPTFAYDPQALERAIGPKTRAILINTPHNPTGKVFDRSELEHIAQLCKTYDLIAITDEVYEHLVFEGQHIALASLDGMRDRTVTISSAGKTYSLTGWKIGYACASPPLSNAIRSLHQFVTFCSPPAFQQALAQAYRSDDDFYGTFLSEYRARRDRLCSGLAALGLEVIWPKGTYFALTDIRPLGFESGVEFCNMLPERYGVAAIPASAFYTHPEKGSHLVRWGFCKTDEAVDLALERLASLKV